VKSATDFQVYKEVANLSGLDVAFVQNSAVYHTKVINTFNEPIMLYFFTLVDVGKRKITSSYFLVHGL
jgi:hypothetical protein